MENANKERPPASLGPSKDPDIQRLSVQFLALAQGLMNDGETRQVVIEALADTIIRLLGNEHMKSQAEFLWLRQFLQEVEDGANDWGRLLDVVEDVADEIERSRAAGGTGSPYQ
ncbi:TPA: hypothetical protein N2C61_006469 [Pseudomonas aeruginosa]|uniref:hypothetical protein n=1 Tax=Alcaligenes xylosoxydans xylosoxydans TaxID=85698 RepID=UPI0005F90E43|nr:hypothetical protein [Achromobacter xylosoxidans]HCL4135304.1 hypothetical protein [Pseudomonas aeruginosa]